MRRGPMPSPLAFPLVHPARERDPRQALRSPLSWACHAPSPGASAALGGGADAPLCPPSPCGGADVAGALGMPNANRPREAGGRPWPAAVPLPDGPAPPQWP